VPGAELSRRIRLQPLGAVIAALPARRALTDATSTSPAVTVEGRCSVKVLPHDAAVVTLAPEGSALSAGLAPEMVAPRTTASARNGMYRRKRRTTGGISMSPFFRASVAAVLCAPSRA